MAEAPQEPTAEVGEDTPEKRRSPFRQILGWTGTLVLRLLLLVLVLVLLVVSTVWALLRTEAAARFVLEKAMPIVEDALPGTVSFSSYSGALGSRFVLNDVVVEDETGDPFITADSLALRWEVLDLLFGELQAGALELESPEFILKQRADGSLNVVTAFVKPRPEPPTPKDPDAPPAQLPFDIVVERVLLTDGHFRFEDPEGKAIVDVTGIQLDAGYTLRDWVHDAAIANAEADLNAPVDISPAQLSGGARLDEELVLDLDGIVAHWNDDVVAASGTLGPVTDLKPDIDAHIERVDLADVKREFAPSAPIKGVLSGDVTWGGTLSDMTFDGVLRTAGGGEVVIEGGGLGLHDPLTHKADLTLTRFDLRELLEVPQLPPALTGRISWDGAGVAPEELSGDAVVSLKPIVYQGLRIGPTSLDARIEQGLITLRTLRAGLAQGTPTLRGTVDLPSQCFDVLLGGDVGALQTLGPLANAPILSGAVALDATAKGCWGKDGAAVALATAGKANISNLAVKPAEAKVDAGTLDWDLTVRVPDGGELQLRGPVRLDLGRLEAAGQVLDTAVVTGQLADTRFDFDGTFTSGPDLGLEAAGFVDWGSMPTLAIHGDRVAAWYRDVRLDTTQPFDLRIRDGAFEASGLVAKTGTEGRVIVQGTVDPDGDADALLRVLSFDLVQTDAFLPEDGKLRGQLEDLTVKLGGTLEDPRIDLRTRVRQFATRGRGPIDLDLDMVLADDAITGTAALKDLLTLDLERFPVSFRLDGKGGLPFFIPPDETLGVELALLDGPLQRFEKPLGIEIPASYVEGKLRGRFTLSGTTTDPDASGTVVLSDLLVDLARLEARAQSTVAEEDTDQTRRVSVTAAYDLDNGDFVLRDTKVRTNSEGTVLELGANAKLELGAFLMAVAGPRELRREEKPELLRDLEFAAQLRRLPMTLVHIIVPAASPVSGALTGSVSLGGTPREPVVRSDLRLLGGRVGDQPLRTLALDASVVDGQLDTNLLLVPELLAQLEETTQATPAATGKRKRAKNAAAKRDAAERERARQLLQQNPDAGKLAVHATAPLPLVLDGSRSAEEMLTAGPLQGSVDSSALPLAMLLAFVPGTMQSQGSIAIQGTIGGTLKDPKPDISVTMKDASFQYATTSVSYEDIDVGLRLTSEALAIDTFSLRTLPLIRNPLDLVFKPNVSARANTTRDSLTIRGGAKLDGWTLGQVGVELTADRFWAMYTNDVKAQITSDLALRGPWPDVKLSGTVDLDEVDVQLGQDDTSRKVLPKELPSNIVVHRDDGSTDQTFKLNRDIEEVEGPPGLLDSLDANVLVRLSNKVRVKLAVGIAGNRDDAARLLNTIGAIEPDVTLGGQVRVLLDDGKPRLIGEVEVTRDSTLVALTRKFEVDPGSRVTFVGEVGDTALELDAIYPSDYGDVRVKVRGQLAAPQIEFVSDELGDQSDIMSVLLTGKPLSEQTAGEGASVARLASSLLAGFGTKLAGKATPLDRLEFDLGDDPSAGSVEAGKALTPQLFLVTRFRWGVEDELENRVEAELQYRPKGLRRFSVEGHIGDRLAGGVELVWRIVFKPGADKASEPEKLPKAQREANREKAKQLEEKK